jgi:ribosomal protein S18 acetylase RimI-like enzyme
MELNIHLEPSPSPADVSIIRRGLQDFNLLHAPEANYIPLTVFVRNLDHRLVGGLLGETYWGWLHISILWIDNTYRGMGYGTKVLTLAESEAVSRGCRSAHLDTMSFQAVEFYERHGYTTFGILKDLPRDHSRHFMTKILDSISSE